MEKAVCYIRVGPHAEGSGLTLDEQLSSLQKYCDDNSLDTMMVIKDESVSGTTPLHDRLGGSDLSNIIESTGVTNVVCLKLDRLFRNAIDADHHVGLWREKGVILHIADMGGIPIRTDGETGEQVVCMLSGFANLERDMASERTRSAIAVKKANRFVYGTTPYGYDQDGNQLTANEKEQEIIQSVREWHAEGWSLRKIANRLNEQNIPTKRSASSGSPTKWYASTIRYLLSNPLYSDKTPHDPASNTGGSE